MASLHSKACARMQRFSEHLFQPTTEYYSYTDPTGIILLGISLNQRRVAWWNGTNLCVRGSVTEAGKEIGGMLFCRGGGGTGNKLSVEAWQTAPAVEEKRKNV